MVGAMMAYTLDEKRKRKALHRASRDEQEQAKARANQDEEPPMTRQDAQARKHGKELQKIWDANGAAIYEANREYTAKHGKEMDAAARSKAIKDATRNGVFNAGAYASNLKAEKTRQDAQNERMANKMTRVEQEEEVRWQAQQKAAEEKQKAEELQAGYAAYYAAMRQGEQEAREKEKSWWENARERWNSTWSSDKDWVDRIVGAIPDGWRGFLLSPLEIVKQKKGPNLVVRVRQETLNVVSSVTNWIEAKFPWTGVESVPSDKLGYYDRLAKQGLDINPTGNLSPRRWIDRLLDIVLNRESKTLVKETAEGARNVSMI